MAKTLEVGGVAHVLVECYNKAGLLVTTPPEATFAYTVSDNALGEVEVDAIGNADFKALAEGTAAVIVVMTLDGKEFSARSEDIEILEVVEPPDNAVDSIKVILV